MPEDTDKRFYIVALGASAGGLEAYEKFFNNMPPDSGMAFILVPHLDPDHASLMPDLIQRNSKMHVRQIKDGMAVKPDNVYILPPGKDLGILNGKLQLMQRAPRSTPQMPIDYFFHALAKDAGEYAIGIVFSGMGMDGSMGLRAIKNELGLAIAQSPETARYDAMPRNAIDTDQVDHILPPEKMPAQLMAYIEHINSKGRKPPPAEEKIPDDMEKIFFLLRQQTGHDFSAYKKKTINRRIERRMNLHRFDKISQYIRYLQYHGDEVDLLFRELLIGVTSFFRDTQAFEALKDHLSGKLMEKPRGYTIRAWVPGCSTGEEVYSLAIMLLECMEAMDKHFRLQLFATDIDERAIAKARVGVYPASIDNDVDAARLAKFFIKGENTFRIRPDIRETIIFAPQNVIKDPPFTRLDLLSCRNLLIYMEAPLQKKLLPVFQFSLSRGEFFFWEARRALGEWRIFSNLSTKNGRFTRKQTPGKTSSHWRRSH